MKKFLLCMLAIYSCAQNAICDVPQKVKQALPQVLETYRWFHSHPELSNEEVNTSTRLAQELRQLGLEVTEQVGGHGVLAVLQGKQPGSVVLYRADMDALPIQETTGLSYASTNAGVVHACGHDLHMSCAILSLKVLADMKDQWSGTVLFVGQPAEEVGSGAEAIIADPKFQALLTKIGQPKLALALHDDPTLEAGQLAATAGFITANVDSVDITVYGVGGHGAIPSATIDPIVIASQIVSSLQTIVSRRLPAGTRAVVTVGSFQAGTKRNIIPATAELQLTVRSYEAEVRKQITLEIAQIAKGIALAHGAPKEPKVYHHAGNYTPAGFNSEEWTNRFLPVLQKHLGTENIKQVAPSMVGEDFSEYSLRLNIPSVMFLLGAARKGPEKPSLHTSGFAPDAEAALDTGANLMVRAILESLKN